MEATQDDKIKSYRETMLALTVVYCHYDYNFVKKLDASQLEDLFVQDAIQYPEKHKAYEINKENINFEVIKEQITST